MAEGSQDPDTGSLFYVICFPQDVTSSLKEEIQALLPLLESSPPNSILLITRDKAYFLPDIEPASASLLANISLPRDGAAKNSFSEGGTAKISFPQEWTYSAKFGDNYIGVNFNHSITLYKVRRCNPLINFLINKYKDRVQQYILYESITDYIATREKTVAPEKHDIQAEDVDLSAIVPKVAVKADINASEKHDIEAENVELPVIGRNESKHSALKADINVEAGSRKKSNLESAAVSYKKVKAYFKGVIQPIYKHKHGNSYKRGSNAYEGGVSVEKPEIKPDSALGKPPKGPSGNVSDKRLSKYDNNQTVKRRRNEKTVHVENRNSCPENLLLKFIGKSELDERCVFSDSETSGKEEVSLKKHDPNSGEVVPRVRRHLGHITNLPLSNRPWGNPVSLVFPSRRKKSDRPQDRHSARAQGQSSSRYAQASDDDPTPESVRLLTRDRYVFPVEPEERNLQHLMSSFTPRVEPVGTSIQRLHSLSARPQYRQYVSESARRESFAQWSSLDTGQNPENMVTNGFFFTGQLDLIRCHMCGIGLKDWSAEDEPLFEHVRHSSDCAFLYNLLGQDVLDAYKAALLPGRAQPPDARPRDQGATNRPESGLVTSRESHDIPIRHPEYASLRQRIESFTGTWPREASQTPRQMAEAGFYHAGTGDQVFCFHCNGGLQRWDPRDDPWIEHTRWFPHCPYLRSRKGAGYVEMVQRAIRESASQKKQECRILSRVTALDKADHTATTETASTAVPDPPMHRVDYVSATVLDQPPTPFPDIQRVLSDSVSGETFMNEGDSTYRQPARPASDQLLLPFPDMQRVRSDSVSAETFMNEGDSTYRLPARPASDQLLLPFPDMQRVRLDSVSAETFMNESDSTYRQPARPASDQLLLPLPDLQRFRADSISSVRRMNECESTYRQPARPASDQPLLPLPDLQRFRADSISSVRGINEGDSHHQPASDFALLFRKIDMLSDRIEKKLDSQDTQLNRRLDVLCRRQLSLETDLRELKEMHDRRAVETMPAHLSTTQQPVNETHTDQAEGIYEGIAPSYQIPSYERLRRTNTQRKDYEERRQQQTAPTTGPTQAPQDHHLSQIED